MRNIKRIESHDLKLSDVPPFGESWFNNEFGVKDWAPAHFALSFDFSVVTDGSFKQRLDFADATKKLCETSPQFLSCFELDGLRFLLFMQQRIAKWMEDDKIDPFAHALVAEIRRRLS